MDIVTQALIGVALSRAFFRRAVPNATLLLIFAATIPDIDYLSHLRGALTALELQRGYTHSLVALPFLAVICVALTALICRQHTQIAKSWLIACFGVAVHLLLDFTGNYGIRALLPFSSRWFYLDWNASYDGVILTALALAIVSPWFVNLVSGEIGDRTKKPGQGSAIVVLLFILMYDGARWSLHERALNQLNSRLYDGENALSVAAFAQPINPLSWTGIVETQDAFRVVKTGSLDIGDVTDSQIFFKPPITPEYRRAMQLEPFRYMAYFARFPVWQIEPATLDSGTGKQLELTDLRLGTLGDTVIRATTVMDQTGRVISADFGKLTISSVNRLR